jgi:hypothetical protein
MALSMQVSPLSRDMERLRLSSPAARKVPVDPKAAAANRKRRSSKQGAHYTIIFQLYKKKLADTHFSMDKRGELKCKYSSYVLYIIQLNSQ